MSAEPGSDLGPLRRYRRLLPAPEEWDAFCAALRRSLPVTVWANPLRTTPQVVARRLALAGLAPEPIAWCPGAFRLRAGAALGNLVEFVTGLYHIQEEVSLLPVELLAPQPGERVLDLCAAPGGKTARMAVAMGPVLPPAWRSPWATGARWWPTTATRGGCSRCARRSIGWGSPTS